MLHASHPQTLQSVDSASRATGQSLHCIVSVQQHGRVGKESVAIEVPAAAELNGITAAAGREQSAQYSVHGVKEGLSQTVGKGTERSKNQKKRQQRAHER